MALTTIPPDAITGSSGSPTGAVTDVDEPVDSPDGNIVSLALGGGNYVLFGFPAAPQPLTSGAGLQKFRMRMRYSGGSAMSLAVRCYEAGTLKAGSGGTALTSSYATYEMTWDASVLTSLSSADVEVRLLTASGTGGPTLQIDSVEWVADHDAPPGQPYAKRLGGVPFMALNRGVW